MPTKTTESLPRDDQSGEKGVCQKMHWRIIRILQRMNWESDKNVVCRWWREGVDGGDQNVNPMDRCARGVETR